MLFAREQTVNVRDVAVLSALHESSFFCGVRLLRIRQNVP